MEDPDAEYVYFQAGGKPGKRLIRNPGDPGWQDTFETIPVIDFSDIDSEDKEIRLRLARVVAEAAERVGFFYASGTKLTKARVEATFEAAKRFFALPDSEKAKCMWTLTPGCRGYESFAEVRGGKTTANLRESFLMGDDPTEPELWSGPISAGLQPQNIWPPALPEFRDALLRYYHEVEPFAKSLLQLFSLGLGLQETALDELHKCPITATRLNHYPPQPITEENPGFLAHADFSRQWISAPALPGTTFVCNVGDYLQQASDGRFVSTVHRVINTSGAERYSIPFFYTPDPSTTIEPFPALEKRKAEAPEYIRQTVGEHFTKRLLHARPLHPVTKRVRELGIPEEEWRYSFLTGEIDV